MSKRTGKAIQLADLLDEVPVDAARFLFNMREASSQMDFDLDLAVQQDAQNPGLLCAVCARAHLQHFAGAQSRGH